MMLLAVNPETWTWGDTWAVTGLGFGIVLLLLCCLVFILKFFGVVMQQVTAPKAPHKPKAEKAAKVQASSAAQDIKPATGAPSDAEKAAIAMALSQADNNDEAAIAMALYLAHRSTKHDSPTAMLTLKGHETAWNTKSIGMNNVGF